MANLERKIMFMEGYYVPKDSLDKLQNFHEVVNNWKCDYFDYVDGSKVYELNGIYFICEKDFDPLTETKDCSLVVPKEFIKEKKKKYIFRTSKWLKLKLEGLSEEEYLTLRPDTHSWAY